jgi:hypothetical protein
MSALHDGIALTPGTSVVPASRNGGSSNADVNGSAIDLRGKRGAYFIVHAGAITGSGNYAARLQTGDNPDDSANANWTNVNSTTYPNAAVSVKTNANSVFEMSFDAKVANQVRAVLVVDANIVLSSISHVVY